jgi:hypothetical protein
MCDRMFDAVTVKKWLPAVVGTMQLWELRFVTSVQLFAGNARFVV